MAQHYDEIFWHHTLSWNHTLSSIEACIADIRFWMIETEQG